MDRELALRVRQGARLKAARKEAGYRSARRAALENEWPESSYRAHEKGTRTIGLDDAERYVRRFRAEGVKVTAKTILFDENTSGAPMPRGSDGIALVPRISWVSASKMADVGDVPHRSDAPMIAIADLPPGDWLALTVKGDSMDRIAPEGAMILINRDDRRLIHGRFYVFSDRGETTFKRYMDKPVKLLTPYSSNPMHDPIPTRDCAVVGRVRRVITEL